MRKVRLPVRDPQQQLLLGSSEVHPEGEDALRMLAPTVQACRMCSRHQHRERPVLWSGCTERPLLALLADTPSREEEVAGRHFVGKHGAMIDRMLVALGTSRAEVFITSSVLCTGLYRFASDADLSACRRHLQVQLLAVKPYVILAMGNESIRTLVGGEGHALASRGMWGEYAGIPVKHTMNLLTLLSPTLGTPEYYKARCWEDAQQAYDRAVLLRRRALAHDGAV